MSRKVIFTKDAPEPVGPYSQAIAAGGFLFCAGQIAIDPKTNQVLQGSPAEQAELVMKNIQAVLTAQGLSFGDIVKTTIFLTNMADFAAVNEVYGRYFKAEPPARSTIGVASLPRGVQVEIEITAQLK